MPIQESNGLFVHDSICADDFGHRFHEARGQCVGAFVVEQVRMNQRDMCQQKKPGQAVLRELQQRLSRLETTRRSTGPAVSCGSALFDALLPEGGMVPGTMQEWVEQGNGGGAGWFALLAARSVLHGRPAGTGRLVILDHDGTFYPPLAWSLGIAAEQIVVVRPRDQQELIWAADQALRCRAVAAVWARLEVLDDRDARRLQLAAEEGNSFGLWVRPAGALRSPSWADVRWHVRSCSVPAESVWQQQRLQEVRLVRCRGGRAGASLYVAIDTCGQIKHVPNIPTTPAVPLVAQLAHPKSMLAEQRRRA